ncbi:MAG: KpsF/GutQ family sugar-phosphate isomerase [Desulfarculales bacterium]|jgi:arabinose-5-phosphate isomerase|nr:KpsF/GutQ family sugar-phosphate isomerase [Desulfarculales bacterium]
MPDLIALARRVLQIEAQALSRLEKNIDIAFAQAAELIYRAPGRLLTTGVGKSGIIAHKIAATFSSIGRDSIFLHPVEALHGDMGMVKRGDVLLAVSHSGFSGELLEFLPLLRPLEIKVIALTGDMVSPLARTARIALDCGVEMEACPLNLVPTASTTAALAMGDALAVAYMELTAFSAADFQRSHPGGRLGQRLAFEVGQVMLQGEQLPLVPPHCPLTEALQVMNAKDLGTVLVVDARNRLLGIFTDGDLRRLNLDPDSGWRNKLISALMTPNPMTASPTALAADALQLMEKTQISVLAIVDGENTVQGILHLHDLLGRGKISFSANYEQM